MLDRFCLDNKAALVASVTVIFLASAAGSYMAGAELVAGGGSWWPDG